MTLFIGVIWNIKTLHHYLVVDLFQYASAYSSTTADGITIEIVIAYCNSPLTWIEKDVIQDALEEFSQASFHFTIMSKCGQEAKIPDFGKMDAVKSVEIVPTDNVGGCDYAYAKFLNDYYIQGRQKRGLPIMDSESSASKDVVLFMKDTPRTKKYFHKMKCISDSFRSIQELIRTPSEKGSFACGTALTPIVSDYHEVKKLHEFRLGGYTRIKDRGKNKGEKAKGNQFNPNGYKNLGDFHKKTLQWTFPRQDYTPVCYGGTFAMPQKRLLTLLKDERFTHVMKIMESALSESKTSVAEHYVERSWAGLLSEPLTDAEASSLKTSVIGVVEFKLGVYGALLVKTNYTCNYPNTFTFFGKEPSS
jgi:hypothetical protein